MRPLAKAVLLVSALSLASSAQAATIDVLFGDEDGFGFSSVAGLVDGAGLPADRNGNGMLDDGDSLPNLGVTPLIDPAQDDFFDNRVGDPALTDVGFSASTVLALDFVFSIPVNEVVIGATLRIVGGDFSALNQFFHAISIDGQPTGEILVARTFDGEVTLTSFAVTPSLLPLFADGQVTVGLDFDAGPPDDIAIDYGLLRVVTQLVPEPSTAALLGLGLGGLALMRSRRPGR